MNSKAMDKMITCSKIVLHANASIVVIYTVGNILQSIGFIKLSSIVSYLSKTYSMHNDERIEIVPNFRSYIEENRCNNRYRQSLNSCSFDGGLE